MALGKCLGHPHRLDTKRFWEFSTIQARDWQAAEQLCSDGARALAQGRLSMSQQLALGIQGASSIPGCVSGSTAKTSRKGFTSLCSARAGVYLEHSPQLWAPRLSVGCSTSPVRRGRGSRNGFGTPNSSLPIPMGAYERTGLGCSQWCLAEGG